MDESLRRAYLAAMDIPVWVLRTHEPAPVPSPSEALAPSLEPEEKPQPGARQRRARDILDELPSVASAFEDGAPPVVPASARTVAPGIQPAVSLLLAVVPGLLFVADAADSPPPAKLGQLLRELGLALTGRREKPAMHGFSWPPAGVAFDERQARDAVLARMGKLRESDPFDRVVLMGTRVASLLAPGDAQVLDLRAPAASARPPFVCATLQTCSAARLLDDPAAKRETWRAIAAARGAPEAG